MKKVILAVGFLIAGIGMTTKVSAQVAKDEVAIVQALWGMEKAAMISEVMKFNAEELKVFVPLYDAYSIEQKKLGAERIQIISEYANNYATMTNEIADKLTQRYFKNTTAMDKLQLKYYNRMKKEISPIRAMQFMQAEIYIQTIVRAELQTAMPMIGEMDGRMKD